MSVIIDVYQLLAGNRALRDFRKTCEDPQATQEKLLKSLLRKCQNTRYGEKHGFGSIRSVDEFRTQVPIATYEDFLPYIEAAMNGEPSQLTADAPVFFATTSGTTGPIKYVPVTPDGHKSRSKLMTLWHFAVKRDHPRMYDHGLLAVISPTIESLAPSGVPRGAESGRSYQSKPGFIRRKYVVPYETFEIHDFEAKYYCMARLAASKKVSYFFTCNPSTVLILSKSLADNTERILRDVRDGTLSSDFDYGDAFSATIARSLRPDPERARFLESAAADGQGSLLPKHVWPELEVIACWKGGTLGQYLDQFGRYFSPKTAVREIGYFASEFFGTIPMSDDGSDGALAIESNFYEFFPADSERAPAGHELLGAHELELGRRYLVYVTTESGLYRYDMNDIVEVCGFFGKTPLVRFVQKRKGITSLTGEKLSECQAIAAVDEALASRRGCYDFIVAIGELKNDIAQYTFLVEFDEPPAREECNEMLSLLDRALRAHNVEYHTKRKTGRLAHAALNIISPGEFTRYRKRTVEAGKSDSVFKTLRLTTDSSFAKEFHSIRTVFADTHEKGVSKTHSEDCDCVVVAG
jgi:hypothetical protein